MRAIVTGAAGFVGSHLCAHLLDHGDEVVGLDCLTDYYDPRLKEANLALLRGRPGFTDRHVDLAAGDQADLVTALSGTDVIYHLAGQPGVRGSWGEDFTPYVARNVVATQRVLEAARVVQPRKVVYASSSSVYGDAETTPTTEDLCPRPVSPYGVTKLAAEHLCELYRVTTGVPTVSLRLFTVYGPRQRPDMAFSRLVRCAVEGRTFGLYGDGEQSRDFTYVGDVVTAMRQAATSSWTGVANIGGGSRTTMNQAIALVEELAGPVQVARTGAQRGDVRHTASDTTRAREGFGYRPATALRDGLAAMVAAAVEAAAGPAVEVAGAGR
ncbi:MAG TPA: NAD-dependent epimerase/dehydratase family protein [Nocardioidaceae bacterium]|nr:NAD-dependent epimerase/dehydratase family protein [Nocardioidaceae bacterium]